jgi:hypothetical protein
MLLAGLIPAGVSAAALPPAVLDYTDKYCSSRHDDEHKKGRLDLTSLPLDLTAAADFAAWVKVHDRLGAGEMPPKEKPRPDAAETAAFLAALRETLGSHDREQIAREGRATQRRLNGYEYENALRDLLQAPWLQIRGQFPDDGNPTATTRSATRSTCRTSTSRATSPPPTTRSARRSPCNLSVRPPRRCAITQGTSARSPASSRRIPSIPRPTA